MVIWALAIAAVTVAAVQVASYRHAVVSRDVLGRIQARWAARAGIEETIAVMESHTDDPDVRDAFAMVRDLEADGVALGWLETGSWDIRHSLDGVEWAGPMDEHAKLNINLAPITALNNLPGMPIDVPASIMDWRDPDDEPSLLGAESAYYRNLRFGYLPRNGDFRSIAELELVAGAQPKYVRGEDWNLNGRLDPNEDDGQETFPPDNADGKLDAGWSGYLTAYSRTRPLGLRGEPWLELRTAEPTDIQSRLGVDEAQANALKTWAAQPTARLETLLTTELGALSGTGGAGAAQGGGQQATRGGRSRGGGQQQAGGRGAQQVNTVPPLTTQQLRTIFQEATLEREPATQRPGRMNINTVPAKLLRDVLELDSRIVDGIVRLRDGRPEGITSVADLKEIRDIEPGVMTSIASIFDTSSSVYSIASRGRSLAGNVEVEVFVVVDRSTSPVRILEYREH
ncbi:MAG TPA: type II secretion system protein GspK [Phycisphaerales bacterium]|nr:type II secretion system protein GspK [Phycisphaerales bacterium]HMP36385.1 type II secretion system protein GspK [Phycisphaerales bacterium]